MAHEIATVTAISPMRYGKLLAKTLPRVIETRDELPEVPPHEMVSFLMNQRNLREATLSI